MKQLLEKIKYQTILIVLGLLVFGVVVTYSYISIDDPSYVFNNPYLAHITFHSMVKLLFQPYANMIRPVDSLVYLIEHGLWGMRPAGYHLVNLLFHITDSILVFILTGFFIEKRFYRFLAALIFLLHPVQVESVAWISEQKSTLSTLFLLVAMISFIKFRKESWSAGTWIALMCFVAGMLVKPNIVVFPVLLVWYDFVYTEQPFLKNILEKYYFWTLSLAIGILYLFFVHKTGFITTLFGGGVYNHILTTISNIAGIAQYPLALIFPFYIHMISYPDHPVTSVLSPQFLISMLFLIIVLSLGFYAYKRQLRAILFFIGWYYINFLLASGIIPIAYQGSVRYLYIPMIGPAVLFVLGIKWLYDHAVNSTASVMPAKAGIQSNEGCSPKDDQSLTTGTPQNTFLYSRLHGNDKKGILHRVRNDRCKILKYTVIFAVALIICSFILIDLVSVRAWKDELSFWRYQVWSEPDNGRDRAFLADTLMSYHYTEPAIEQTQQAVTLSPDDPVVWGKTFYVYYNAGMFDKAIETLDSLHKVLINNYGDVDPVFVPDSGVGYDVRNYYFLLYSSYADVYFKTSRYDSSVMYSKKALALQPANEHVFALEADILLLQNKPDEVISLSNNYINLTPNVSTGYLLAALAYEQSGKLNEAVSYMDKAIARSRDKTRRDFMIQKRQALYDLLMKH